MWDEMSVGDYNINKNCDNTKLIYSYDILQHESGNEYDKALVSVSPACDVDQGNKNALNAEQWGLRIGTWDFRFLCSEGKALEIGDALSTVASSCKFTNECEGRVCYTRVLLNALV